jgi:glycosyltransferase involved in cell wall biosynthesis
MLRDMKVKITATQTPALDDGIIDVRPTISPDMRVKLQEEAMKRFNTVSPVSRDSWPDQSTKDPKVTLGMMVCNEQAHIAECLESMKSYVDEIVIVDTGSTDDTIEICKKFGAKVYEHPWEDSFSVARNHVISHIGTPWMIQMDADEIMEKKDAVKVRDTVRSAHKTTANLVHMVLINKAKDSDEVMSVINTGKIMRVLPGLHFKNRVHNRLVCTGDVIQTNLTIIHHGYSLPDAETMKKKRDRTTRLLLMQRSEQPEDPETSHYLAIQYLRLEDYEMCICVGKQAIDLWERFEPLSQLQLLTLHTTAMANYQLGSACTTKEEQRVFFDDAIKYSEMALEKYPDYLDSNCLLSSIYFATKDHEKCQKYAEKFLAAAAMIKSDNSKSLVIPLMSMKHEWMVCLQLAINYFEQADADSAISMIGRGEALLSDEQKYKMTWGVFKYMITLGDPVSLKNAESIYMVGFRPDIT